jgi:hypothetical protein
MSSVHLRNDFYKHKEAFAAVGVPEVAMKRDDANYYSRRALEEHLSAQRATCAAARDRHEELATMYRFRAGILTIPSQPSLEDGPAVTTEELA